MQITDQGREFVNNLNQHLFALCGVEHRVTSAYHPQTNGLAKRFNRTLIDCLRKVTDEEDNWDRMISPALFAYRTSKHASTGMTPFKMVYGREARLPIDVAMKVHSGDDVTSEDDDTRDLNAEVESVIYIRCILRCAITVVLYL